MKCVRCNEEKDLEAFYSRDRTCKDCRKALIRAYRLANIDLILAYDRRRGMNPDRVAARKAYAMTGPGKEAFSRARARWKADNKQIRDAHIQFGNAIRSGKIVPQPCFICGGKADGHHPDYDRPLSVVWLCRKHHAEAHAIYREVTAA